MRIVTLRNLDFDSISPPNLEALVSAEVPEGRDLDYKRDLVGDSKEDKREFLADVCSLANVGGGDLVFGMDESAGVASAVTGVELPDPDAEILRLEQIIHSGLDPRLTGVRSRDIELPGGRRVLIVRIPRSFNRPHAVAQDGRLRFHSRNSRGKYTMDVAEVRDAVLAGGALAERLRSFRTGRLSDLVSGETPVDLSNLATVSLHLLPLSAFDVAGPSVNLGEANRAQVGFLPIGIGGNHRHNFDGLLVHGHTAGRAEVRAPEGYALLFRSGIIEAADSILLWPDSDGPIIPSILFERDLLNSLERYMMLLAHLGVEGPVYVALSLLNVRGYKMATNTVRASAIREVDRDDLVVPEVMAEGARLDRPQIESLMQPVFDQVWNACGLARSMNFDNRGHWVGR